MDLKLGICFCCLQNKQKTEETNIGHMWPTKCKIFALWPFAEKFADCELEKYVSHKI